MSNHHPDTLSLDEKFLVNCIEEMCQADKDLVYLVFTANNIETSADIINRMSPDGFRLFRRFLDAVAPVLTLPDGT